MNRYLKYVKMKTESGKTIALPACCMACPKKVCPLRCPNYELFTQGVKCNQFEMEFGLVDTTWDVIWKCIYYVLLLVIVACIPLSLYLISQNMRQRCEVPVERYAFEKVSGRKFGLSYSGMKIDTNVVMSVVGTALDAVKKGTDDER